MGLIYHAALENSLIVCFMDSRPVFCRLVNTSKIKIFPVAQLVEHGVNNAKIMGSIPRESKSW